MKIMLTLIFLLLFQPFLKAKKLPDPPGTVQISDSLFCDQFEITNYNWKEYRSWLKYTYGETSKEYKKSMPDTSVWRDTLMMSLKSYYYKHPTFSDYPVVGLTFKQVQMYCAWRTDRVNEFIYYKLNKIKHPHPDSSYNIPQYYVYRLPTPEEYAEIASIKNRFFTQRKLDRGKIPQGNFLEYQDELLSEAITITAPVKSFHKNKKGIYNIFGNVAEMSSIEGTSLGGSFRTTQTKANPEFKENYTYASNTLGFRCVAVKREIK